MKSLLRHVVLAMAAAVPLTAAAAIPDPVQLTTIVEAARRGAPAASAIATLTRKRTTYALRGSDFGKLRNAGISNEVLDHLQQSFVNDVDLLVKYWVGGESLGKCANCYPQQIRIDESGTISQGPPPLRALPGRPLGMPDWFRPIWTAYKPAGLTVEELRQMVVDHKSEADMLAALEHRPLVDLIGVSGGVHLGRYLKATVSGSQLADLRAAGMPDAVLDKLQTAVLATYVEHLRLRYMGLGKGSKN
ncbi:MAG: hypothetical protein U1F52_06910 [Burkholderiales bacterium]